MERWFSSGSGMGIAWRLDYRWPWPPWATLLGVAALVAAVVAIYLREGRQAGRGYRLVLAAMRLLAVGLVLLMIAQLELFLQRTGLPFVVVIVDDTQSMRTVDSYETDVRKALEERVARVLMTAPSPGDAAARSRAAELSRWNIARMILAENDGELLARLADSHKLRFYFLSAMNKSQRTDVPGILDELKAAEANGESTRLGAAVRSALDELRGTTPAAIVLATDGINTEGPGLLDAAGYARRKGVQLLLIGVGGDRPARDLKLSNLEVEDVVFVNDLVHFRVKLTAAGFAGKTVSIVLRRESGAGAGRPSAEKGETVGRVEVVVAADGRPQEVVLPHRPTQAGQFRYTIDVEPPPGDPPTPHPPLARSIQVRDEKLRVLLVEGAPRLEYRYLHTLLSRDKTIVLDTLLQGADLDFGDAGKDAADGDSGTMLKVFPLDLKAYDVVIFGDVNPSLLGPAALKNLADFVDQPDNGRALVLVAGPNFMPQDYRDTPLARLMPFDPAKARNPEPDKPLTEGFVAQPTEIGLASPAMQLGDSPEQTRAIWQELPPLYWLTELSDLGPSARVLAEHPARRGPDGKRLPLIIMQYVGGGGKVLFHATDETYRWRRAAEDLYFGRYWVQTLRYLARSKLAEGDRSARLFTDRRDYATGDPVRVQVRFSDERLAPLEDDGVTVELEQNGRQTQKVQLHRTQTGRGYFEAVLNDLPAGGYHAKLLAPSVPGPVSTADFSVTPPQTELANVQVDAAEMQRAAKAAEGHYYTYKDAAGLIRDLPAGRQVPVESLPLVSIWNRSPVLEFLFGWPEPREAGTLPLWNRWPVLALFLGLLIGEWLLRKRKGMV
jgi:hypothetical protein